MVFPLRVIDVKQTTSSSNGNIIFHKPTSWDFHTISHTWSKGVQSWSDKIGSMLLLASGDAGDQPELGSKSLSANASSLYEELFRRENFSGYSCYAPFMDFLLLLQADGVRYVWLDALCINQASESGEKSQELRNMGSYYAKSAGCYVCAHGFGEGFQIWRNIDTLAMALFRTDVDCGEKTVLQRLLLPRWFSRVWTFQESLLPSRLTFIFQLSELLKRTINYIITGLQQAGVHGPCKCVMSGGLQLPSPASLVSIRLDEDISFVEEHRPAGSILTTGCDPFGMGEGVEILGINSSSACLRCGGYGFIRKPVQIFTAASAPATSDLYFIDREAQDK